MDNLNQILKSTKIKVLLVSFPHNPTTLTVGKDFMTSIDRFTYGINELSVGIGFIPVVVGLFAISEMLTQSTLLKQVFKRVALKAVKLQLQLV